MVVDWFLFILVGGSGRLVKEKMWGDGREKGRMKGDREEGKDDLEK